MRDLFCKPDTVEPCGVFTVGHWVLLAVTVCLVSGGLWLSRRMEERQVRRAVRILTAALWVLEVAKIAFVLLVTGSRSPNDFVPLYYCSLMLYAGAFSALGRGWLRRVGDVFIATGGIVGGVCFLLVPNTSLPRYPALHFISLHSFLLHGVMVYLGFLMLWKLYRPQMRDLKLCASLVSVTCGVAYAFNLIWDRLHPMGPEANLMFLSHDFPGTPLSVLYRLAGVTFPLWMWLGQAFLPFLAVYGGCWVFEVVKKRKN